MSKFCQKSFYLSKYKIYNLFVDNSKTLLHNILLVFIYVDFLSELTSYIFYSCLFLFVSIGIVKLIQKIFFEKAIDATFFGANFVYKKIKKKYEVKNDSDEDSDVNYRDKDKEMEQELENTPEIEIIQNEANVEEKPKKRNRIVGINKNAIKGKNTQKMAMQKIRELQEMNPETLKEKGIHQAQFEANNRKTYGADVGRQS